MIAEIDVLEEVGQIYMADLERLPLADLDRLLGRVAQAKESARHYEQLLQAALNHRFSQRAQELRQREGKSTGTVRLVDDGYTVIADLPKRTEYDQKKLKDAVAALRKWGEDPEDYVAIEIKVAESKYGAWPPAVRQLFEPARTLKVGKPLYKLEPLSLSAAPAAANDSHFGEAN